jgi:hypothetical protein
VDELKKKILLDLCVTPGTVIPGLLGASLLLLSVAMGGMVAFLGFVCLLLGFGCLLTNFVFNLGKISRKAAKEWQDKQQKKKDRELDLLDRKLESTRETADENALRNLRALYRSFCGDYQNGKVSSTVPPTMLQQIDDLFEQCIYHLTRSFEIFEQSKQVTGKLKKGLQAQRKELIDEVERSVETLAEVINEVRAMRIETQKGQLGRLQRKLTGQLSVAKATEEQVRTLDYEADVEDTYGEYLDEDAE